MDWNHIAPCGIDCVNCELFADGGNPAVKDRMAAAMGKAVADVECAGCRARGGCVLHADGCATLDCVNARGHRVCSECADFPCRKLLPMKDGAERYPHNLKAYNLAVIRSRGPEAMLEEAAENRRLYFDGRFAIGTGPLSD